MHSHPGDDWGRGEYRITTRRDVVPVGSVHAFLTTAYWSPGVSEEVVRRSIESSVPFTILHAGDPGESFAGFGRVISDFATFAYIADVFVLPEHRGRGLGKWLVETMLQHPELSTVRGWYLRTRDAHGLYVRFGFAPLADPTEMLRRPGASRE